jgi:hypothetical protein
MSRILLVAGALVLAACSGAKATPVVAADYLPLTEAARDELPPLAYQPGHTDEEYLAAAGTALPAVKFYIKPLSEERIARRTANLQADFERVLGKRVTAEQVESFSRAIVDDVNRRRLAVRALLDLKIDGKLSHEELERRLLAVHDGLDPAFRRITGLSKDEHDKLSAGNQ